MFTWHELYPDKKQKISVLRPPFRPRKSGLFGRAVESVLSRTLIDIELIIVDDGIADQIAEFQQRDSRISCLRHKNVGLPTAFEYKASIKARADYISFAFDNTMFNDDALEKLPGEAERTPWAVEYGHIN